MQVNYEVGGESPGWDRVNLDKVQILVLVDSLKTNLKMQLQQVWGDLFLDGQTCHWSVILSFEIKSFVSLKKF